MLIIVKYDIITNNLGLSITSIYIPIMATKNIKTKKDFYLVSELADSLRVSLMTIYRYIKAGKIKAHKIGKEFRISKDEFERFLKKVSTK